MTLETKSGFALEVGEPQRIDLDLVVPFTTPGLTRAALHAADQMGAGLGAVIRLIKVQLVPYPLDLANPQIPLAFLERQLNAFTSELPAQHEIRLAREFETGLAGTLHPDSLVVLATRHRPWRTRNDSIAVCLRRAGYRVVVVPEEKESSCLT